MILPLPSSVLTAKPVFRFAPSPNGRLHLGHAFSALLNQDMALARQGRLLLRLEDIDQTRCKPEFEHAILDDLAWLGVDYEKPVRRQSHHFGSYENALEKLKARGLIYPAFMTRSEIKAHVSAAEATGISWPCDPDGAPLYPDHDRNRSSTQRQALLHIGAPHAWRLDMKKALGLIDQPLFWLETGQGETQTIPADPSVWGDVVLSRSDAPSSYHLSVVVDDAVQGVTHVVRGRDLFAATAIHRLLQELLELPAPLYHHHRLIIGPDGQKLSKTFGDTGIRELRALGFTLGRIRNLVGL